MSLILPKEGRAVLVTAAHEVVPLREILSKSAILFAAGQKRPQSGSGQGIPVPFFAFGIVFLHSGYPEQAKNSPQGPLLAAVPPA